MITLINGKPQNLAGLIVPNGSIGFQLNCDATVIAPPFGFVSGGIEVVFQFDGNGNIQPNAPATAAQIYSNKELNPQNATGLATYYLVTFYDTNGARLNQNPMWWQFPEAAGATVDIGEMTPLSTVGGNVIFYPTAFGGGGTVTSVAFAGDGVVLSAVPSSPVTSSGTLSASLLTQGANTFLAGPTSGPAANPTFRAITVADLPATVNIWNDLASATGNLTLANTTFTTTFNQTTGATWTWANLTAATSGVFQPSPLFNLVGTAWNGSASVSEAWTIQVVNTPGIEASSTLTFTHNGVLLPVISLGGGISVAGNATIGNTLTAASGFFGFQTAGEGGTFPLSAAGNASAGLTTYTGVITPGGGPSLGMYVTISGFTNGVNNGHFLVQGSTPTTLVVYNAAGVAETHSGSFTTDLPYYNNGGGYSIGFNLGSNTYAIEGTNFTPNSVFETFFGSPVVMTYKGNSVDSEYFRIINDPVSGNHGLEIGSIIDGTGAAPVTLQMGFFNGLASSTFNGPFAFGLAGNTMVKRTIKVPVTSAQLKALPGTTFNLIPAQGANKIILVDSITIQYKFVTTQYTLGNNDNVMQLKYTGGSVLLSVAIPANGLFNQAANAIGWQDSSQSATSSVQTNMANLGVDLTIGGTTPGLTVGDGTAVIWLQYTVVNVS